MGRQAAGGTGGPNPFRTDGHRRRPRTAFPSAGHRSKRRLRMSDSVVTVWRIASDTPTYTADDMQGEGARITGGRWNKPGSAVVYSAGSIALACLESVVHLELGTLPLNRYLVQIDIPASIWQRRTVFNAAKHVGW